MIPDVEFREAIARSGITPPDQIMADGKLHRFASNGKRSDDAGWYIFYPDGVAAGAYGCWRTDLKVSWRANIGRTLTPAEEAAIQAKMAVARREREREEARRHAEARQGAGAIWKAFKPAPNDHPYLVKKGVKPHGLRVHEGALIIPIREGVELHSLQFIGPDGDKRFLSGGRAAGCYFSLGRPKDAAALCICEGFATGASIHEATGYPVVMAFNAGNLLPVAKAMRKRFTNLRLIVCGDDDAKTPGNPGRAKATEAAQAAGGAAAFPSFGEARPEGLSDFNDLHRHVGLEAVRSGIEQAARGTAGAAPAPTFITAAALWDMRHHPTRWAVPEILPEGVCILAGKPKVGKSWLALDLALAVGAGGLALGKIPVEPGPALCLALEETKRRLTKRLRILCRETPPSCVEIITECPRLGAGGEILLREWLEAHPAARLVVIDTLARFRPAASAADSLYVGDYSVGQYLGALCRNHQVAILIVHHTRKMASDDPIDLISGTLGLAGGVDGFMVLQRMPGGDAATLYVAGRDIEEPGEHAIAWDRDSTRWRLTGEDPRLARLAPEQRRTVDALRDGAKSFRELAEALNPGHVVSGPNRDPKYKAVSEIVYKLRDKGLVEQRAFDRRWGLCSLSSTTTGTEGRKGSGGTTGTAGTTENDSSGSSDGVEHRWNTEPLSGKGCGDVSRGSSSSSGTCPPGAIAEIRGWLQTIGEDPETIAEVLEACAGDPGILDGYLRSARGGGPHDRPRAHPLRPRRVPGPGARGVVKGTRSGSRDTRGRGSGRQRYGHHPKPGAAADCPVDLRGYRSSSPLVFGTGAPGADPARPVRKIPSFLVR